MNNEKGFSNKFNYGDDASEPILQQPPAYPGVSSVQMPYGGNTTVIIQQPAISSGGRLWSSGICSCFDDMESCCCVMFFPTCYTGRLYSRYGECCCSSCCVPNALFALRVQHRNRHKLSGSILNDMFTSLCCYCLSACQLKRDMDYVVATKGTLAM